MSSAWKITPKNVEDEIQSFIRPSSSQYDKTSELRTLR